MTETTKDTRFTVQDYMALPEGFPAQLIEGWLVKEPAPTRWHQGIVVALTAQLLAAVDRRRVLVSPTDVVLDRWNVFQPDVLVFPEGVRVTPTMPPTVLPILVVEVLSPGTARRDRGVKCAGWLRAGIVEVWLVDPDAGAIEVRTRDGSTRHAGDEEAVSAAVPGFRASWRSLAE